MTSGDHPKIGWRSILAVVMLGRLLMAALLPVTPEEAHHWNWARHLDWCYSDHPPLLAWSIALGRLAGGDTATGIRLVPLLFSLGTSLVTAWLAGRFYGPRGAAWAVFLLALEPCVSVIGGWGFPDAPLLFFWSLTLAFVWRALDEGRPGFWLAAGVTLGAGMLSKYTAAFLVPSVLCYVLTSAKHRRCLAGPWPYLAGVVSLVVFSPVVYWNARHDWASFHFQGTARLQGLNGFSLLSARNLIGEQWLCILPLTLPLGLVAVWHGARSARPDERFLFWSFLPTFAFVALFGLTPNYHLLWPLPAYLGLTVLMAGVMVRGAGRVAGFYQLRVRWVAGVALAAVLLTPVYECFGMPGIPHAPELYGWDAVADRARRELRQLPAGSFCLALGVRPYPFPSQLALHLDAPELVRAGTLLGRDVLNYRFWDHPERLVGKDAVVVLQDWAEAPATVANLAKCFRAVEPAGEVTAPVGRIPLLRERRVRFLFYRAYGYRGVDGATPASVPQPSARAARDTPPCRGNKFASTGL